MTRPIYPFLFIIFHVHWKDKIKIKTITAWLQSALVHFAPCKVFQSCFSCLFFGMNRMICKVSVLHISFIGLHHSIISIISIFHTTMVTNQLVVNLWVWKKIKKKNCLLKSTCPHGWERKKCVCYFVCRYLNESQFEC